MIVLLTHGAGSNKDSALLLELDRSLSEHGVQVERYDLPYRVAKPSGPPRRGDPERDRESIRERLLRIRESHPGETIVAGGHSYGGRQTSMAAAENAALLDGLLLLSYPLHPPRERENLRTAHFPQIATPCLFVHGTRDPFGLPEEMRAALELIPARKQLLLLEGAGHELGNGRGSFASEIAAAVCGFFEAGS